MNTPEFILQALFFVVNSFALCFLAVRELKESFIEHIDYQVFPKKRGKLQRWQTCQRVLSDSFMP